MPLSFSHIPFSHPKFNVGDIHFIFFSLVCYCCCCYCCYFLWRIQKFMLWWIWTDVNRQMILIEANNLNYLFYARDNDGPKNQCACMLLLFLALIFNGKYSYLLWFLFGWICCKNSHTDSLGVIQSLGGFHIKFANNCVSVCVFIGNFHYEKNKKMMMSSNKNRKSKSTKLSNQKLWKFTIIMSLELKCFCLIFFLF